MYLAGDIGGTKTHLAIFKNVTSRLELVYERKTSSHSWENLAQEVLKFIELSRVPVHEISAGCLSLAGPIQKDSCSLVNLNRVLKLTNIRDECAFPFPLAFYNDLVALGHGVLSLPSEAFVCLNPLPFPPNNQESTLLNRAVIAPGTGLGESIILGTDQVLPTEGAHVDFAPRNELEVNLWRFLSREYGHVSYERVVSGPGLVNLYRFFHHESSKNRGMQEDSSEREKSLTPAEIADKALSKTCPICVRALNLFVEILGAEAGNLALKTLSLGGVYIGGGIPPKILPKLRERRFLESFQAKGRFSDLLIDIPVYVILNENAALYGAARIAQNESRKGQIEALVQ